MKATTLARFERFIRPFATRLPSGFVVSKYSQGRLYFLDKLKEEFPSEQYPPRKELVRNLWGIEFRSPIMNSAGIFKNGECYEMVTLQGAGAYLGGTGTWNQRKGNEKSGISLPFAPYPKSHSASNCLELPNDGDVVNSYRASKLERIAGCPIGWSVSSSPDFQGEEKLNKLVKGIKLYENAGVDFIEINESCPNIIHSLQQEDLEERLKYVKEQFLDKRNRKIPIIVKFSNDTKISQVPELLDLLFEYGYDGVNFGNTSVDYSNIRCNINTKEKKLFDYFVNNFGGGISGRPLKYNSLYLAGRAVEYLNKGKPPQEFHVIRTGGIENYKDIKDSDNAGISLNQWYTGYIENFANYGHKVYEELFKDV